MATTIYTPLGMLGYGFPIHSMEVALQHGFDVIALDAGSVDPGPYYLGSGKSFTSREMVKRDLGLIIDAGQKKKVPVLIGTAGGSGAIPHVDWVMEILNEIIKEQNVKAKIARIDAELNKVKLLADFQKGKIKDFEIGKPLTADKIEKSIHIVAQMGIQPFINALAAGADIIVGGRAYDAAVIAAFPIWKGEDPGLCYHMGKIMECGTIVALPRESDGMLGIINDDSFRVFPADLNKRCFPDTVAAHTLYERTTPLFHAFPGGQLDLSKCTFTAYNDRTVEVKGSKFMPSMGNFLKIEGSALMGYRTICIAGIRDPFVIEHFFEIEQKIREKLINNLHQYQSEADYRIIFHRYGGGEVMGLQDPKQLTPEEIGLVIEVISHDQSIASTVCSLVRSAILHMGFEGRKANSGNLAFLYTPAEFEAPPCYEFLLYHLWEVNDLCEPFPITYTEVGR